LTTERGVGLRLRLRRLTDFERRYGLRHREVPETFAHLQFLANRRACARYNSGLILVWEIY